MYTLRRITGKGVEMNFGLGGSYTIIHKDSACDEFERDLENFENTYPDSEIYCFVWSENGTPYPLFKNQQAYIMTDSGKTLSNLTLKN